MGPTLRVIEIQSQTWANPKGRLLKRLKAGRILSVDTRKGPPDVPHRIMFGIPAIRPLDFWDLPNGHTFMDPALTAWAGGRDEGLAK